MQSEIFKRAHWSSFLGSIFLSLAFIGCGGNPAHVSSAAPTPAPVASPNPNQSMPPFDSADEFTLIALPDTQYYSRDFPDIFRAQTQWIVDHVQDQRIQMVLGLGDIVDDGADPVQWQNADAAVSLLDGEVPYMMAIGNHDYANAKPAARTAGAQGFNSFFGPARYSGASWYRDSFPVGSNENFYGVLNINGRDYLILVLEFAPRDLSLAWADAILKANQDKEAIIVTHAFTFTDNTRMSRCDANSASSFGVGQDNDGEDVWWKLVHKYGNVRMVLSGHVNTGDGTGHRIDLGDHGNLVNQMLSDYQSGALGGGGFLRVIRISPSLNRVSVLTYSPYNNSFKTDDHNQFTVPYLATGGTVTGAISGKVQNIVDCQPVAGVKIATKGGTAVSDANGVFSIPAPALSTLPISATLIGWASDGRSATATANAASEPSPAKIFVAEAGRVTGSVRAASGLPVAGAAITFTGGDLRVVSTAITDSSGAYDSGPLAIGIYSARASAAGRSSVASTTAVKTGASAMLNFTLQ
jgi:hypothetical protein